MKGGTRFIIPVALIAAGIIGMVLQAAVPPSELARKGVRALGEVQFKDSRPDDAGRFVYTVTFVFPDAAQRNHQVTRVVPDKGVWDRLRARQEVRVLYMPDRPDEASIEGAEGLARPHGTAYAFLSWSAILAGVVLGVVFLRSGTPDASAERRNGPKVARGGHR
jgi:hypothetical protein